MQNLRSVALFCCFCSSVALAQARHSTATQRGPVPDVILFNGVIYTGNGFATDRPEVVEAMAIGGGKVIAVGTTKQVAGLAGPQTKLRDLDTGSTSIYIFPGFNDAHAHLGEGGLKALNLDLFGATSLADLLAKTQKFAASVPSGHWITGGRWDHTLWPGKKLPSRQDLDNVTGDHPAYLDRVDGHIAIVNSAALKAAGITGKTAPPQGGVIDLDTNGNPTGILRESAKELVAKIIPPPTADERRKAAHLAIADALSHGVTSVQDNSDWDDFLAFEQLEKDGDLNIRITEWLPFNAPLEQLKQMRAHHDAHDPMLHTGMLKGFMDGSLGSQTAAMKAPYSDAPGNSGLPQYKQDDLNRMTAERARAGFQIGFHAIGDKAAAMALEAFSVAPVNQPLAASSNPLIPCRPKGQANEVWDEKVTCAGGARSAIRSDSRNRIEHDQVVDPTDIPRYKKLGVIASMQPNHLLTDMNWAESRLGPRRAAYSYAWKAFLNAGVPLAFGTDYPVEPITPFRGLYAAVTRMNEAGTKSYYPQNKLTRGQALYAYTQGSAYADFAETHKGKLAPGYDADFILVDRDLYKIGALAILHTRVQETWVAGRQAFPATN